MVLFLWEPFPWNKDHLVVLSLVCSKSKIGQYSQEIWGRIVYTEWKIHVGFFFRKLKGFESVLVVNFYIFLGDFYICVSIDVYSF